jgi:hypothetical protein
VSLKNDNILFETLILLLDLLVIYNPIVRRTANNSTKSGKHKHEKDKTSLNIVIREASREELNKVFLCRILLNKNNEKEK